ncbi:MAG: hypothetical protein AB7O57_09255 [Hyphomicrobiaceae bacterium]
MDDLCCFNSGGRAALTITGAAGHRKVGLRGSLTIMPTNTETEAGANSDGSLYVTTKPVPATCEIKISDKCGLRLEDLTSCTIDATIELIDMRRTYLFTRSRVVGRPSLDSESGEITGLKIASSNVQVVEGV